MLLKSKQEVPSVALTELESVTQAAHSPAPLCFTYIQATGANSAAVITVKTNAHDPPIDLKIQTLLIPSTIHTDARHEYQKAIA